MTCKEVQSLTFVRFGQCDGRFPFGQLMATVLARSGRTSRGAGRAVPP